MNELIKLIGPLSGYLIIAVIIFMYIKIKHKERMALIEKGVEPSQIYTKKYVNQTNLRNAILLIALAIGLIVGYIITVISNIELFVAYAASLLLCEGAGFLIYYRSNKKINL